MIGRMSVVCQGEKDRQDNHNQYKVATVQRGSVHSTLCGKGRREEKKGSGWYPGERERCFTQQKTRAAALFGDCHGDLPEKKRCATHNRKKKDRQMYDFKCHNTPPHHKNARYPFR